MVADFVVNQMQFVVKTHHMAVAKPGWYTAQTHAVGKVSHVAEIFVALVAQNAVLTHVSSSQTHY